MKSFAEIRNYTKMVTEESKQDPPSMITMRRTAIRIFPNDLKIALYRNDKLNLDISIPYKSDKFGDKELTYAKLKESIIRSLKKAASSGKPVDVSFDDGTTTPVQPAIAKSLLDLHSKLNTTNGIKLNQKISTSYKDFKDAVDFTRKGL